MITVRLATKNDCLDFFILSNMDYVRAVSFNKEKISWESHVEWFSKNLLDSNVRFYVIEDENFIGYIRLVIEHNRAIVSIDVLAEYQKKGYATQALGQLIRENNFNFAALVMKGNTASQKLFERLKFLKTEYSDYYLYEYKKN